MMVLLSTLAASAGIFRHRAFWPALCACCSFLVLWFVLGIYLVPTFYKRSLKLMNNETMLVTSIGLLPRHGCSGNASRIFRRAWRIYNGFAYCRSAELRKNRAPFHPGKRYFRRSVLRFRRHAGRPGTACGILAPHYRSYYSYHCRQTYFFRRRRTAFRAKPANFNLCGFSLAQIGEFSFIIASLGMSLGVISDLFILSSLPYPL